MRQEIILGRAYHWWRGDPLPSLPPLAGFEAQISDDDALLARLHDLDAANMRMRFEEDNRCYLAMLDGEIVGYGWIGARIGRIYELDLAWPLSEKDRLLWDFVTLPAYRGRGVYPHLLQTILKAESASAERFWIGHTGDNHASQRGIVKAGFILHNLTVLTADNRIEQRPQGDRERALADPMLLAAQEFGSKLQDIVVQQIREQFEERQR